ncbi:helix-turn-helix domain-containing protein [Ammonifex degensii]
MELVMELIRRGMTQKEIAARLGVSQATVSRMLARTGARGRRGRRPGSENAHIREDAVENLLAVARAVLLDPGAALGELAAATGVAEDTVRRALTRIAFFLQFPAEEERKEALRAVAEERGLAVSPEEALLLARAAHARWESCARGAWGVAAGVLATRYHRAAASLLRLMRRFLPTGAGATQASVDPAPVGHPVPRPAAVKKFYRSGMEKAARAQARQQLAGVAVAPGPGVFAAYYLLRSGKMRSGKKREERDALATELIREAVEGAVVVGADLPVASLVPRAGGGLPGTGPRGGGAAGGGGAGGAGERGGPRGVARLPAWREVPARGGAQGTPDLAGVGGHLSRGRRGRPPAGRGGAGGVPCRAGGGSGRGRGVLPVGPAPAPSPRAGPQVAQAKLGGGARRQGNALYPARQREADAGRRRAGRARARRLASGAGRAMSQVPGKEVKKRMNGKETEALEALSQVLNELLHEAQTAFVALETIAKKTGVLVRSVLGEDPFTNAARRSAPVKPVKREYKYYYDKWTKNARGEWMRTAEEFAVFEVLVEESASDAPKRQVVAYRWGRDVVNPGGFLARRLAKEKEKLVSVSKLQDVLQDVEE